MKKKAKKVVFYSDSKNDDFFEMNTNNLKQVDVDANYVYLPKSILFKLFSFIFYYLIAIPILTVANLLFFRARIKGRKNLKGLRKKGYFVYANHTNYKDSWLTPISIARLRKTYIIAEKTAVRIPFVGHLVKAAGGLPVPDTPTALKNLTKAIDKIISKNQVITIFPEAHIWPYYTGVRDFPTTSFRFPSKTGSPAVPVAVCYKKKLLFGDVRKPRQVIHIGKPVYPKSKLSVKENAELLRDECHAFIKATTEKESTYSYVEYVKTSTDILDNNTYIEEEKEVAI